MKLDANGFLNIRKPDGDTANIVITGDCCPRSNGEALIIDGHAEEIIEPVMDVFRGADLSIMQFETPLTEDETPIVKSGPNLKCSPETIDFLHAWGGDVALLANNHIGDYGPAPVLETIQLLNEEGFKTVGAGKNLEDAYKPLIVKAGDFTVGILNFAEHEFGTATAKKAGSAPIDPCRNIAQIRELTGKVDICMVVTHGGNEQNPLPSPRVVTMLRAFVDAGANIVVNIHTHCPQGIEEYNGGAIIYSLGNFYFPWPTDRPYKPSNFWCNGMVASFKVDKKGVCSVKPIPIHFEQNGESVSTLSAAKEKKFYKYLTEISAPLSKWEDIVKYYEAWCVNSGYPNILKNYTIKPEDFDAKAPNPKLMGLRNLLTCEAHNELLTTYMRLVEEGRLKSANRNFGKIKEWSEANYVED